MLFDAIRASPALVHVDLDGLVCLGGHVGSSSLLLPHPETNSSPSMFVIDQSIFDSVDTFKIARVLLL